MPELVNTTALDIAGPETAEHDTRETMIKVDHVSMVFNMASEQLNSLKEYAIKLAKRELFFEGFTALDDVSFEVKKGDVFGIMGTNGSGKSTMMKIIAGVMEPTSGTCTINGNIAPLIELGAGFDLDLSARENIYLNGALLGYSKQFIDEHFDEIVEFAEVEKFLDMPLKNYSSGMVARIAFAIATVIVPDILLVDEVLSVGDFMFQKKCEDRIKQLIEEHGVTVLIVSHSNEQVARLCNKAIWIEKGHTRLQGNADTVCRVYGELGGRTGRPESEKRVFDAIVDSNLEESTANYTSFQNQSPEEISLSIASFIEGEEANPVAIVACGNSHINALTANAIAGVHRSPILITKPDSLSHSAELFLARHKPKKVFFFDCGSHGSGALQDLEALSWNPEIIPFRESDSLESYCLSVINYVAGEPSWSGKIALSRFSDGITSLKFSPALFEEKTPVMVFSGDGEDFSKHLNELEATFATNKVSPLFKSIAAQEPNPWGFATMCQFDSKNIAGGPVLLAEGSPSHWPSLLSCGPLCGIKGLTLRMVDSKSLDSIASELDFISANAPQSLFFIGSDADFSDIEKKMFAMQTKKATNPVDKEAQ